MRVLYPLLLFIVFLGSCKKDNSLDGSPEIVKQGGVIRVECNSCVLSYKINFKQHNIKIEKGSNDVSFLYSSDFSLITEVVSKEEQKIRVLVLDALGRVVSNELKSWNEGERQTQTFLIKIK